MMAPMRTVAARKGVAADLSPSRWFDGALEGSSHHHAWRSRRMSGCTAINLLRRKKRMKKPMVDPQQED